MEKSIAKPLTSQNGQEIKRVGARNGIRQEARNCKSQQSFGKAPKEKQSALANKLLLLWAKGLLSATLIRELADLAI